MTELERHELAVRLQEKYMQEERDWEDEENKYKEKQNEIEQEQTITTDRSPQLEIGNNFEYDLEDDLNLGQFNNLDALMVKEAEIIKDNFKNGVYNDTEAELQKERLVQIEEIINEYNKTEGKNTDEEIEQPLSKDIIQNEMYKMQNDGETKSNDIEK